jgi:DHA3 family macrolide efflux protein-like MFS transporter
VQLALRRPGGMAAFSVVWLGQVVSLLGTGMSSLALGLWAWQETGSATALAMMTFFATAPALIFGPLAGALVDRWDRQAVLVMTDLVSGLGSLTLFALYAAGLLEIWHLYLVGALTAAAQSFQWPAYGAAITLLVPREQYGRANGMVALAEPLGAIAAPALAGMLVGLVGIAGVLAIDILTFLVAVAALLLVRVPRPPRSSEGAAAARNSLLADSLYGFRYIRARPGLLGLLSVFLGFNLISAFSFGLMAPYVLARSGGDARVVGAIMAVFGIGGVAGGVAISLWGGPRRRIDGVLVGMALGGLLGMTLMGVGRDVPVWAAAIFLTAALMPLTNGSSQAIWQAKVQPDVQGRVFAARRMIAQLCFPLGLAAAGPVADRIFEPALQAGGTLAGAVGWLVGTGPGAGMGLMFVASGLIGGAVALCAYLVPAIRNVERELPDHG